MRQEASFRCLDSLLLVAGRAHSSRLETEKNVHNDAEIKPARMSSDKINGGKK